MKRILAYFFLICSFILILGHSILPHHHLEEEHRVCRVSEVKNISIAEIIILTLSHDLCANHLEEYKNCNLLAITTSGPQGMFPKMASTGFSIIAFLSKNENFAISDFKLAHEYFFLCTGLRAPPHLS